MRLQSGRTQIVLFWLILVLLTSWACGVISPDGRSTSSPGLLSPGIDLPTMDGGFGIGGSSASGGSSSGTGGFAGEPMGSQGGDTGQGDETSHDPQGGATIDGGPQ